MTDYPAVADIRIYVASLSDYNNGVLHGEWIDATQDEGDIQEAVNSMLAKSPTFKSFPAGGPAEEWAIHDYDGFGSLKLGEYESFERVSRVAQAIELHGDAVAEFISSGYELDDFEDSYCGEYDSFKDYVYDLICETAWGTLDAKQIEENINIIDVDSIARDLTCGGDNWTAESPDYKVYVFRSV